jgi:hypothetical protein
MYTLIKTDDCVIISFDKKFTFISLFGKNWGQFLPNICTPEYNEELLLFFKRKKPLS